MRRTLVTGGTGFIEQYLVALLARDRRVRILDLRPPAWARAGTRYVNGSVLDATAVHDTRRRRGPAPRHGPWRGRTALYSRWRAHPVAGSDRYGVAIRRRKGVHVRIPAGFTHMTAAMMEFLADHVTRWPPAATVEAIRIAVRSKALSSEKSRRELGYTPRPIEPTLQEAIEGIPGGSAVERRGLAAAPL